MGAPIFLHDWVSRLYPQQRPSAHLLHWTPGIYYGLLHELFTVDYYIYRFIEKFTHQVTT